MLIEDFILRVKNLDANKIIVEAASLNETELADLNVLALEKGFMATGERMVQYENPDYAKYKKESLDQRTKKKVSYNANTGKTFLG